MSSLYKYEGDNVPFLNDEAIKRLLEDAKPYLQTTKRNIKLFRAAIERELEFVMENNLNER